MARDNEEWMVEDCHEALSDFHKVTFGSRPVLTCTEQEWNDLAWLQAKWAEIEAAATKMKATPEGRDQLRRNGTQPEEPALPLDRVLTIHAFAFEQVRDLLRYRGVYDLDIIEDGSDITLRFMASNEVFEEAFQFEQSLFSVEFQRRFNEHPHAAAGIPPERNAAPVRADQLAVAPFGYEPGLHQGRLSQPGFDYPPLDISGAIFLAGDRRVELGYWNALEGTTILFEKPRFSTMTPAQIDRSQVSHGRDHSGDDLRPDIFDMRTLPLAEPPRRSWVGRVRDLKPGFVHATYPNLILTDPSHVAALDAIIYAGLDREIMAPESRIFEQWDDKALRTLLPEVHHHGFGASGQDRFFALASFAQYISLHSEAAASRDTYQPLRNPSAENVVVFGETIDSDLLRQLLEHFKEHGFVRKYSLGYDHNRTDDLMSKCRSP